MRWRGGWARLGPWRAQPGSSVAQLSIGSECSPSAQVVDRCLALLRDAGYAAVVTSAMPPAETLAFVDAGFTVRERLHLLAHDLRALPRAPRATRRGQRLDRAPVLTLDGRAFDSSWRLGTSAGFDEALHATPLARFRVVEEDGRILGYAITGLAGAQGYLQRVAVDPDAQGRGRGRVLVADSLRWLARRRVSRALVNTQERNDTALALYLSCGFRRLPAGLCVLGREL